MTGSVSPVAKEGHIKCSDSKRALQKNKADAAVLRHVFHLAHPRNWYEDEWQILEKLSAGGEH